jgi:hypothetical protein
VLILLLATAARAGASWAEQEAAEVVEWGCVSRRWFPRVPAAHLEAFLDEVLALPPLDDITRVRIQRAANRASRLRWTEIRRLKTTTVV